MNEINPQNLLNALYKTSLSAERKAFYADKISNNELTDELKIELNKELEQENKELNNVLNEMDSNQIQDAVSITEEETKKAKILDNLEEKITKLRHLKEEYEDKIEKINEFYDPLIEELRTEDSKQKLIQEKEVKMSRIIQELQKLVEEM